MFRLRFTCTVTIQKLTDIIYDFKNGGASPHQSDAVVVSSQSKRFMMCDFIKALVGIVSSFLWGDCKVNEGSGQMCSVLYLWPFSWVCRGVCGLTVLLGNIGLFWTILCFYLLFLFSLSNSHSLSSTSLYREIFFCEPHWWGGNDPCWSGISPLASGHLDRRCCSVHTDGPFQRI